MIENHQETTYNTTQHNEANS